MTLVDDLLTIAGAELGKPYEFGAEGPGTFDCSGLMQYAFGLVGIALPRTAAQQQTATTRVTTPAPGDLVFYGQPAHHVGLYIGNGKMIDAPDVGKNVEIDNVGSPTNYGRVGGLGAGLAPVQATLAAATGTSGSLNPFTNITQWVKDTALGFGALLLALILVAAGGYQAVTAARKAQP